MSYGFSVRAANKQAAIAAVSAEIDKVVAAQAVHEADRDAAQATAATFIIMLADDAGQDISVSVSGSISVWGRDDMQPVSTSISVSASLVPRP